MQDSSLVVLAVMAVSVQTLYQFTQLLVNSEFDFANIIP
jgi:hypothetical protein